MSIMPESRRSFPRAQCNLPAAAPRVLSCSCAFSSHWVTGHTKTSLFAAGEKLLQPRAPAPVLVPKPVFS